MKLAIAGRTEPKTRARKDAPNLRGPFLVGLTAIGLFFGGFIGWASVATLRSGAIAPGMVIVDSNRKEVQHLEGGIVGRILVTEGQKVKAGQTLIELDDTQSKALRDQLFGRQVALRAEEARLIAERDGAKAITFPPDLLAQRNDKTVADAISGQKRIFASRRETMSTQIGVLTQRIRQFEEEIRGMRGEIAAEDEQLRLIAEELRGVQTLVNKGLERKTRLLSLKRRAAEIKGARSRNVGQIARARQSIGEAKLKIAELKTTRLNDTLDALRKGQVELMDLDERERAAADVLKRTRITAPMDGTVVGLKVHTPGGVIAPGAPLMEIVPSKDRLIVEARVEPGDIDEVHKGLAAKIRLTALPQRNTPPLNGKVMSISADRLVDDKTGKPYYLARLAILDKLAKVLPGVTVQPGMQAEVIVVTGERHPIDYLLQPLVTTINRSMRER